MSESTPIIAIYYYYSAWKLILIYRPMEGRRPRRPGWLVTYRDGLPAHRRSPILVLTGSDVVQLWGQRVTSKPNCQQCYALPQHSRRTVFVLHASTSKRKYISNGVDTIINLKLKYCMLKLSAHQNWKSRTTGPKSCRDTVQQKTNHEHRNSYCTYSHVSQSAYKSTPSLCRK